MVFLVKNILTASKRTFAFKSGESLPGSAFHWKRELSSRDCSARWSVTTTGSDKHYVCELIDPAENEQILALTTNVMGATGGTVHEGLANILASGWILDGVFFQVLDLDETESPLPMFAPARKMDETTFLQNAERLIEAMIHMHKNNLLHSAISPECIRVDAAGMRIGDFWWTRAYNGKAYEPAIDFYYPSALSNVTALCLAPEVIRGETVLRESDLFALGCTFFYMLTGEFPRSFEIAEGQVLNLQSLAEAPMKDLRKLRPDLKPQVYDAIDFCLQADDLARENIPLVRELIKDACD
jgi:serine/threonine protein kinase